MIGIAGPVDLGPRYDGGRYLATMTCSLCHGSDLTGSADGKAPDLDVVASYSREQFFNLLRLGWPRGTRKLKVMTPLAQTRFHVLKDYEIDALYLYLVERKITMSPVPASH